VEGATEAPEVEGVAVTDTCAIPVCDAVAEGYAPELKHELSDPSPSDCRSGDVMFPFPDASL